MKLMNLFRKLGKLERLGISLCVYYIVIINVFINVLFQKYVNLFISMFSVMRPYIYIYIFTTSHVHAIQFSIFHKCLFTL